MLKTLHTHCRLASTLLATILLVAGGATPVRAAPVQPSIRSEALFAASGDESFSMRKFLAGMNRRERVVQLCVGVMCLALFILCKKLDEEPL